MRLSRDDQIAGLSATDARVLMRHFRDGQPESRIGSWIDTGSRTGAEVARAFEDAGYLTVSVVHDGETYWEATIKGNALAQASFGPPITRARAEGHLAGVIDRAQRFNADGSHVIDIAELVVFGSYLDRDVQHLGDLDLGVSFRDRISDTNATVDRSKILLDYAKASGRRFRDSFGHLSWAEDEALQILGNGSKVINITCEDVRALTDRWEVVYSHDGP